LDVDAALEPALGGPSASLRRGASVALAVVAGLGLLTAAVFAARHDNLASGLLTLMAAVMMGALLTANHALDQARRRLRQEKRARAKAEQALHHSLGRALEARQVLSTERGHLALRRAHVAFALNAGELGSWTRDLRTGEVRASELFRLHHGLAADAPADTAADFLRQLHPSDRDALVWRDTDAADTLSDVTGFYLLPVAAVGLDALAAAENMATPPGDSARTTVPPWRSPVARKRAPVAAVSSVCASMVSCPPSSRDTSSTSLMMASSRLPEE